LNYLFILFEIVLFFKKHPGQLVAGLFHEFWYRSLIEEVNVKCDDLVIFFRRLRQPGIDHSTIDPAVGRRHVGGFASPSCSLRSNRVQYVDA